MTNPVRFVDLGPPLSELSPEDVGWVRNEVAGLDPRDYLLQIPDGNALADDDELAPLVSEVAPGRFEAGRFVGELRIGDRVLSIEPRLGFPVLAGWLAEALNIVLMPQAAGAREVQFSIPQLLAVIWVAAVADASRHSRPAFRRDRAVEGRTLRGRLDVRATALLNGRGFRDRAAFWERERSMDNPLARVLVRADAELSRAIPGSDEWWRPRAVRELIAQLRAAVGRHPELPTQRTLDRIRYTPITVPYKPAARLSHLIARSRGLLSDSTDTQVSGMLIDVAEVWELFVVQCCRRAFGSARVEHSARSEDRKHLLESTTTGRALGRMRPDILVRTVGGATVVMDAKYKRLRSTKHRPDAVDRGDMYQLASYVSSSAARLGALIYPPEPEPGDAPVAELEGPWRLASGGLMSFSRVPASRQHCAEELLKVVTETAGAEGESPVAAVG